MLRSEIALYPGMDSYPPSYPSSEAPSLRPIPLPLKPSLLFLFRNRRTRHHCAIVAKRDALPRLKDAICLTPPHHSHSPRNLCGLAPSSLHAPSGLNGSLSKSLFWGCASQNRIRPSMDLEAKPEGRLLLAREMPLLLVKRLCNNP